MLLHLRCIKKIKINQTKKTSTSCDCGGFLFERYDINQRMAIFDLAINEVIDV